MEDKEYSGTSTPSLVLEDSDHSNFGLVKDTEGNITWRPGEGLIVGQWSKSPIDNCYHLWLEKSVDVMCDERLLWWMRVITEREAREQPIQIEDGTIKRNKYIHIPKQKMVLDPETKQFRLI